MKKIKRVKKARKVYGTSKGDSFLSVFYSYCISAEKIGGNDRGRELSEFRTKFNQYVLQKYGRKFYDEYCVFHMLNKDNKTLIKSLNKKKTIFLNCEILELLPDKEATPQKLENNKGIQKEESDKSRSVTVQINNIQSTQRTNPYVDLTPGRLYDTLPARNIDYLRPSFSKRSFKITMKRLNDGSEFVVYHQGKDANEAMAIANRHSFDNATIIKVEEDCMKTI